MVVQFVCFDFCKLDFGLCAKLKNSLQNFKKRQKFGKKMAQKCRIFKIIAKKMPTKCHQKIMSKLQKI